MTKDSYFGILSNLEDLSHHYGTFDSQGKLNGFGSIGADFKGEFKNGWLNGYSHILTRSEDKEDAKVNEVYCGNTKSGVLYGFGVLLKPNLRYFGYFKKEKMSGYGVLEFWNSTNSESLAQLEFENLTWGMSSVKSNQSYAIYKGEFSKNKKSGVGYLHDYELKEKYLGEFKSDKIEGFGRLITQDFVYIGDLKNGFQHGLGL